tara:strand:- start:792 stop:1373 length:582 start_codon:yes stop_codon:yes gene_type:complete
MSRLTEILILIIFLPFFLLSMFLISLILLISQGRPILFQQVRVGKNKKKFRIYKFRTMKVNKDIEMNFSGKKITKIGKYLRKYKLDEIPQIINILKNEMSIVGPRPEIVSYIEKSDQKKWNKILKFKPGLTDLATIKFRNEEKILKKSKNPQKLYLNKILPKKQNLNIKYLKHKNTLYDLKILFKTISKVLFK